MTPEHYEKLQQEDFNTPNEIHVSELEVHIDRTLLYGFTVDRETFHVYLQHGFIHRIVYMGDSYRIYEYGESIDVDTCNPGKRLYPEDCDYEFCRLVAQKGGDLPFTKYSSRVKHIDNHMKGRTEDSFDG